MFKKILYPSSPALPPPNPPPCCAYSLITSDSLEPNGLQPASLFCLWGFSGKNRTMGCHALLQGIFTTQGSNPGLLHCKWIFYHLSHQEVIPWCIRGKEYRSGQCLQMQETGNRCLGQEDPLGKGMATHSSILLWIEELGRLQSVGSQRVGLDSVINSFTFIYLYLSIYLYIFKIHLMLAT